MTTILRLATISAFGLLLSGCVVHSHSGPYGSRSSALNGQEQCPPGHRWSDGRCHDKGKGHDPYKKAHKHKGHD